MKNLFTLLPALLVCLGLSAQEKGFVRGVITDGEFGGPMIGAAIVLADNPSVGTTSDFDGNFSLSLDPGTYSIQVSFISYATITVNDLEVKSGEVTPLNLELKTSAEQLAAVEVTAQASRNSEAGMLLEMRNATNVVDGLSSQTFKKLGDSDLSGAMNRVTGVNVQGGKYVFVRGLGDRYTKTTVNGMSIPGLDPDKNSVQIDIFPTTIVENVAVYKTFSPNLPADFSGGLINVTTNNFPEEKTTKISARLGWTLGQTMNDRFRLYDGGSLDFLGIDDGTRKIPIDPKEKVPAEVLRDPRLRELTEAFPQQMAVQEGFNALPNGSLSFTHGNQKDTKNEKQLGYNFVFNYNAENVIYEDYRTDDWLKDNDLTQTELAAQERRIGDLSKRNVMWSAMASGAIKGKNSHSLMLLWTQAGESTASHRVKRNFEQTGATLLEDVLTFTQRSLGTAIADGRYQFEKFRMEWRNASSLSRVYDPDFRITSISVTEGDTTLNTGDGAGIQRFYRDLNELNQSDRIDFYIPIKGSKKATLSTGLSGTYKYRDFSVYNYKLDRTDANDIQADPDWFLQTENLWSADPNDPNYRDGTFLIGNFQPSNQYQSNQYIAGAYVKAEHPVGALWKFVYGLRVENTQIRYNGEDQNGNVYDNQVTLDATNLLPSANLVYALNENTNIRVSANRTLARPTFREISKAQIYDPISDRLFIGNLDLKQTTVNNYDLRYEYFFSPKEVLSVAAFYKQFDGHIEMTRFKSAPENITPSNAGTSTVYGVELEFRKAFAKPENNKFLSHFFFAGNASFIQSAVDMREVIVDTDGSTEYELRQSVLRQDAENVVIEDLDEYRAMAGQSPYMINANLTYEIPESRTGIALAYNVQGEQLSIVGSGRTPDVYLRAFHSLNANCYTFLGEEDSHKIGLRVNNILNDDMEQYFKSYEATDQIFSGYSPGVNISVQYGFTF